MTQDDILRIAKETGIWASGRPPYQTQLWRFADRILEHLAYDGAHTCNAQRPACVREAVKAEREACAKLALQGTGKAVQIRTLKVLQSERQRIAAAIEQQEKQEPLGYWNAVQGWVELPEEPQPVAWVYPEALEAFRQGKPWAAYGISNGDERIPLYTAPQQWVRSTDEPCAMRHSFDGHGYRYIDSGSGSNWQEFARRNFPDAEPLYEHPRQWVGLTEEEKRYLNEVLNLQGRFPVIDAIETKLREKNT